MLSACGMQGDLYLPDESEQSTKQEKSIKQEVKVIDY